MVKRAAGARTGGAVSGKMGWGAAGEYRNGLEGVGPERCGRIGERWIGVTRSGTDWKGRNGIGSCRTHETRMGPAGMEGIVRCGTHRSGQAGPQSIGKHGRGTERRGGSGVNGLIRIEQEWQDRNRTVWSGSHGSGAAGSCRIGRQRKEADGAGRTGLRRRGLIRGVKHWSGRIGWCRSAVARVASARKVAAGVVWVAMER